jgi:hypothetical protein
MESKSVKVFHKLSKNQKEIVESYGIPIEYVKDSEAHSHPVLHYVREICEVVAVDILVSKSGISNFVVEDVGGNPNRCGRLCLRSNLGYHSHNPILDGSDAVRCNTRGALPRGIESCDKIMQECETHGDGLLLVHSLYHIEPLDLLVRVLQTTTRRGVSVHHRFDGMSGSFPASQPEATFKRVGRKVSMTSKGNNVPYVHDSLDWLLRGSYTASVNGELFTLCWSTVRASPICEIVVFTVVSGSIRSNTEERVSLSLTKDIRMFTSSEAGREVSMIAAPDTLAFDTGIFYYLFSPLTSKSAVIPRELMDYARLQTLGIDRSKNFDVEYRKLITSVKAKSRDYQISSEELPQIVLLVVHLALRSVDNELEALERTSTFAARFSRHSKLLSGGPSGWAPFLLNFRLRVFDVSVGVGLVGGILACFKRYSASPVLPAVVFGAFAVSGLFLWLRKRLPAAENKTAVTIRETTREIARKDGVQLSKYSSPNDVLDKEPKCGAIIKLPVPTIPTEKPLPTSFISVQGIIPPVAANDSATRVDAVIQRVLNGTEVNDDIDVKRCVSVFQLLFMEAKFGCTAPEEFVELDFEEWIATRYGRRNDPKRVAQLKKAHQSFWNRKEDIQLKIEMFVKDEAYSKVYTKPRGIMATNDEYLTELAPSIDSVACRLKNVWSPKLNQAVAYLTNVTPLEMGEWVERCLDRFPGGKIVENDIGKFESSISVQLLEVEFKVYTKFFSLPPAALALLRQQLKMRITSRDGFSAVRRAGRASGVPNTSCGNSLLNAIVHTTYFLTICDASKPLRDQFCMGVNGDDNITFLSSEMAAKFVRDDLVAMFDKFKWEAELKVYEYDNFCQSEFCSGWFPRYIAQRDVKVNDRLIRKHEVVRVWTPKCAKLLLKGFRVAAKHNDWRGILRGTSIGYLAYPKDPIVTMISHAFDAKFSTVKPRFDQFNEYKSNRYFLASGPVGMLENFCMVSDDWVSRYPEVPFITACTAADQIYESILSSEVGVLDLSGPVIDAILAVDCPELREKEPNFNLEQLFPNMTAVTAQPQKSKHILEPAAENARQRRSRLRLENRARKGAGE